MRYALSMIPPSSGQTVTFSPDEIPLLQSQLLAWYDRNRRAMPWRALPGELADPYRVWLSEVMLQQTTVAAVKSYFEEFLRRWPTVEALAAAPLDDVLHAWAGLGYYARARNLHKCAQAVVARHGGRFPGTEIELRGLPGIGDYTAAAVTAIAFGLRAVILDGNVERVMARMGAVRDPLPGSKPLLKALADSLTPEQRAGDYGQAAMDLGATICTPRSPACGLCPWMSHCRARIEGIAETLPAKMPKPERPTRYGTAYWLARKDGAVLLRRRVESGLLGGMMEIPSTQWLDQPPSWESILAQAPVETQWREVPGVVRHTFTHFHLEITLVAGRVKSGGMAPGIWCALDNLSDFALPSVMKKIIHHALAKAY